MIITREEYLESIAVDLLAKKKAINEAAETGLEQDIDPDSKADVDLTKFFSFKDSDSEEMDPSIFSADPCLIPEFSKTISEHFDMTDRKTCRFLTHLNEDAQNTVLNALASKLYDNMMKKCEDIDYGEIPATKGDVTKLTKYDTMKDTLVTIHDLLKEYKQDTGPVDELTVALSNLEARKDLFERAYKYNSEMPMAIYCNVVYGIIVGITFMIASCIEFIKDPGTTTFKMSLDKMAYAKTKDNMIYESIKNFNKACEKKELDKAMEAIMKVQIRGVKESTIKINEVGFATIATIAAATVAIIIALIYSIRELIFLFYYLKVKASDLFDLQANIGMINLYSLEQDDTIDETKKQDIIAKQKAQIAIFRKLSDKFLVEMKKAEVKSAQEKKFESKKMTIDDFGSSSSSALF